MGLYERDFHYYTVYYLGRQSGLTQESAEMIAWASQYVDDAASTTPHPLHTGDKSAYFETLRTFHFHAPKGEATEEGHWIAWENTERALRTNSRIALGAALHSLADSFSHATFSAVWEDDNRRLGTAWPNLGHGDTGEGAHAVDKPYNDVDKAVDAARAIYEAISNLDNRFRQNDPVPFDQIEAQLRAGFSNQEGRPQADWMLETQASNDVEVTMRSLFWRRMIRADLGDETNYQTINPSEAWIATFETWSGRQREYVNEIELGGVPQGVGDGGVTVHAPRRVECYSRGCIEVGGGEPTRMFVPGRDRQP